MSTFQRMTLIGIYNYLNRFDRDLFEKLELPEGYEKTTFVNSLLLEHGEKCVMYTNPDFMVDAIGMWSSKYRLELKRIYQALTAEYNPIWNYDRNEEWEDHGGHKKKSTANSGRKTTDSPKYNDDLTNEQVTNGTTEHEVSADNSADYQPSSKDITNIGKSTSKRHVEGKTQDLAETINSKVDDELTDNTNHKGHLWGNIGVTTSASMVSEVVRQRFSMTLYGITTKIFANDLLLGLW